MKRVLSALRVAFRMYGWRAVPFVLARRVVCCACSNFVVLQLVDGVSTMSMWGNYRPV